MKKLALAAALVAGSVASSANAVVIFLDSVAAEGSNFRYTYAAEFSNGEGIKNGSTLAIFDFGGYVPGSITTASPQLTGTTPNSSGLAAIGFTDDASIPNLQFTYNGPTQDLAGGRYVFGSALSRFGRNALDGFSAITVKTAGVGTGTLVASQGGVGVPVGGVPEPAIWAMMIGGFGAIGFASRRRRQTIRVTYA
jgi:hypothetical protein